MFLYAGLGLGVGLFVTVALISGLCALTCTSAQALPPAITFAIAVGGCVVAFIYGVVKLNRSSFLWTQLLAWTSGAFAYAVAYVQHEWVLF
jgi:uncharacterized protein (DUF983 family)